MNDYTWRTTSRISLAGLPGWGPTQRVEAVHASGRALVRVETCAVGDDGDLDSLAAQHAEGVTPPGAHDTGLTTGPSLGAADGRIRTTTWSDEQGRQLQATTSYALSQGRLVTVTTVVADGDATLATEAARIVASADLFSTTALTEESLPLRPGEVDLGPLADAWSAGTAPAPATRHVVTTEESFAAARRFGVAMLPGADTGEWDQLDSDQRELASAVAWRSLEARGAGEPGDLRDALEIAASHDLIVMVAERSGEEVAARWFAARPDRMVCLRPDGRGRTVLSTHPSADLADLVLDGHGDPALTVTASAVYRSGGHVVGDEQSWTGGDTADSVRQRLGRLVTGSHAASTP